MNGIHATFVEGGCIGNDADILSSRDGESWASGPPPTYWRIPIGGEA